MTEKLRASNFLKNIREHIVSYVFPSFCLGCDVEGVLICPTCIKKIPIDGVFCCPGCHSDSDGGRVCPLCIGTTYIGSHIAVTAYSEHVFISEIIHTLKYCYREQTVELLRPLFELFFQKNNRFFHGISCVVPVPLHARRYAERGFNQAALIARLVSNILRVPYRDDMLKRQSYTKQQATLSKQQREHNVHDAFVCPKDMDAEMSHVLLVDDVYTTGSTIGACAQILQKHGVQRVQSFSLARG